jgi:hypothetical protein
MSEEKILSRAMEYIAGALYHREGPYDWEEARHYLGHPDFPGREAEFKEELDGAIENRTITPEQYLKLTDKEFETPDEVAEDLRALREYIYGEEVR